jgi:hypothetical protein
MLKKLLGEQHPDIAATLGNLSIYASRLGDDREAVSLAEQALAMRRALLGEMHPDTLTSEMSLLGMQYSVGKSQSVRNKARALKKRTPKDSPAYPYIRDSVRWMEANPPHGFRPK